MLRWILLLFIAVFIGCGDGEQPLSIIEDEEQLKAEAVGVQAPEGEIPTTVIRLSHSGLIRSTHVNSPMNVLVVENGLLIVKEIVFQERFYYLLIPESIDGVAIEQPKNHGRTYINVLNNRIRVLTAEDEAKIAEEYRKELGLGKDEPFTIDQGVELGARYDRITPIRHGDEIEVVIKHKFKYKETPEFVKGDPDAIIFVDVLRNLTRSHIEFQ